MRLFDYNVWKIVLKPFSKAIAKNIMDFVRILQYIDKT